MVFFSGSQIQRKSQQFCSEMNILRGHRDKWPKCPLWLHQKKIFFKQKSNSYPTSEKAKLTFTLVNKNRDTGLSSDSGNISGSVPEIHSQNQTHHPNICSPLLNLPIRIRSIETQDLGQESRKNIPNSSHEMTCLGA